jgi:hypothetical protein
MDLDLFAVRPWVATAVIAGAVLFTVLVAWFIHTPKKGTKKMVTGENERAIVANIIERAFSDAAEKGEITARKSRYWRRKIGRDCDIEDLQPRRVRVLKKMHPYRINLKKEEIKARLANGLYKDAEGKRKVSPIPGDKPLPIINKENSRKLFKKRTTA